MTTEICTCAECGKMMFEGDDLVQNPVYKCGELSYIELAHRACIPAWAVNDDWGPDELELVEDEPAAPWVYEPDPAPRATLADLWPAA